MDFKQRFKGKTSTISKEGIESLISNSNTPVKKDFYSPLIPLTQSTGTSNLLDQTPKQKTLQPSTMIKSDSVSKLNAFERGTPKSNTFTPGTQIYSFQESPSRSIQRPSFLLKKIAGMSPEKRVREDHSPILIRETKNFSKEARPYLRDQSNSSLQQYTDPGTSNYVVNNFYNQQTQLSEKKYGVKIKSSTNDVLKVSPEYFLSNNQMHKMNFESLSQQNKKRQLSQEVGRGLVSKNQTQQYYILPLDESREPRFHSNPYNRKERVATQSPLHSKMSVYGFDEEVSRENNFPENHPRFERQGSLVKIKTRGSQAFIANNFRNLIDQNSYQEQPEDLRQIFSIKKNGEHTTPMRQVQEQLRFRSFQSMSDLLLMHKK